MSIFSFLRKRDSAPVARERLQIMLAHERATHRNDDLVATLREEILAVIARHVPIDRDRVQVKMERGKDVSVLEVEVELPGPGDARLGAAA